jgi:hypothetical protein
MEEESISAEEKHDLWKRNSSLLYDFVYPHELDHAATCCKWVRRRVIWRS